MATKKAPKVKKDGDKLVNADISKYHVDKNTKTASGRKAVDSNDKIAKELRGSALEDVYKAASKARNIPATQLRAKYGHLNPGMQRMNLGNLIRGAKSAQASA